MHYAGERYFSYMSEAQQMVSEFGETVATLDTQDSEETDSILPCSATLYLTGKYNYIESVILILCT
jgi:prefoldin subunit 5